MRRLMMVLFFACAVALTETVSAPAAADTAPSACDSASPAFTTDDLSGISAPCAVVPGALLVETLYYQNASRDGGTALAAYPLFRLRAGVVRHLEVVADTPSQIAESGPHGIGLYPTTQLGYGLDYTFASGARTAAGFGVEVRPPSSRFTVNQTQPKYVLDLTTGFALNRRATLSAIATGSSSTEVGFNRVDPAAALRFAYATSATTQISTDFGARVVVRRAVAQSYGDFAVNERLHKNVTFDVGVGTAFNPVSDAKPHYLAGGFNFQI
jgi:hypothetical protein